ncbi:hypothetical protein J4423_05110 [Candidatus Pacearchaeota archaeon]|nr:hypothetical protein [Candidatus Pacearchaeota archaeon]
MGKKGQIEISHMADWIMVIGALILLVALIILAKEKGSGMLEFFKNLWRFGR